MSFNRLLLKAKEKLTTVLSESPVQSFSAEHPKSILFFVASNGRERAHVEIATGASFEESWASGVAGLKSWRLKKGQTPIWLRVEAVHSIETLTWQNLQARLKRAKRNYFRFGIALTADFKTAMLEHELYANALLYKTDIGVATANAVNLKHYGKKRFGRELEWPIHEQDMIWRFKTRAVFTDGQETHVIEHDGRNSGYRLVEKWDTETVTDIIETSTEYLSKQVKNDGEYHYGWFPCFDRAIPTYNALRHASSTYALLEGWEVTQERKHKRAIDRALDFLTHKLIKTVELPDGTTAAFLVDLGDEIKLGGNAVCILAYAKYTEVTGDKQYITLMEQLAVGIVFMQKPDTGQYVHILNYPDLSVKAENRIIYYDGEAAFGLMRLYGITQDPRWLASVEKAFDYFIEQEHWKAHDHWLSYCVNELTLYNPDPKYYTFGLDNVRDHLDFVLTRITTFPTLLELMMAAQRMIERMQNDASVVHLLDNFDVDKFYRALEYRARYLLNGFFYPEVAMFFQNPARILGGFFIRHHTFRVRIDDVEHYLSGYVAYRKYLKLKTPMKNKFYFCNSTIEGKLSGVERSSFKRALLFDEYLNICPDFITTKLSVNGFVFWEKIKEQGLVPKKSQHINIYEDYMLLEQGSDLGAASLKDFEVVHHKDISDVVERVRIKSGLVLKITWRDSRKKRIYFINYYSKNKLIRREYFGCYGQLGIVHYFCTDNKVIQADVFDIYGRRVLSIHYQNDGTILYIYKYSLGGARLENIFNSEEEFIFDWLKAKKINHGDFFLIDKNRVWGKPLSDLRKIRGINLISTFHSSHLRRSYDKPERGNLNSNYSNILLNKWFLDVLVILTPEQLEDVKENFNINSKLVCIPHTKDNVLDRMQYCKRDSNKIVTIGRLSAEKQFDHAIAVMELVIKSLPSKTLHIYGVGATHSSLQAIIKEKGLENNVFLKGHTSNVAGVLDNSALYLCTSKVEGFPLTLIESLSHGVPIVSYDIKYGPSAMIENGVNGYLVEKNNVKAAAEKIIAFFKTEDKARNMSDQAYLLSDRYSKAKVASMWKTLIYGEV